MPRRKSNKSGSQWDSLSKKIKRIDREDLKSDFDYWPTLADEAWTNSNIYDVSGNYDSVLFIGMGGSGITGALICDYAKETKSRISFSCLNDYHLPPSIRNNTLVVGVSSSGGTEETLSALNQAHARGLEIVSFGSGGLLRSFSEKWESKFTQTRALKTPRSSMPAILFAVLKFFANNRLLQIKDTDVRETIGTMGNAQELAQRDEKENPSLKIAKEIMLSQNSPLIYCNSRTHAVGLRFRQSLNENSKLHAFNGDVPEICHNDVVAWDERVTRSRPPNSRKLPIGMFVHLPDDSEELKTRFEIMRDIIQSRGGKSSDVPFIGDSYLSRTISMLYLLDYTTYFLAVLRGVNPIETPSIELLKKELGKRLDFVTNLQKQQL